MNSDISGILNEWEFDSEENIRLITADDGREIMQVRLPLGIEQYELEGRPDGKKPFGKATALEEFQQRLDGYTAKHDSEEGFSISHEDFLLLQNEGVLFYYRYLLLFQIGDFKRTALDTEHNLKICRLVEKYCENGEDRKSILQYKPYILRVNAIARAMLSLREHVKLLAEEILEKAIQDIRNMPVIDTKTFDVEKKRSLTYLKSALTQVKKKDVDPVEKLKHDLKQAVEEENYERAAELRDRIYDLEGDEAGL